jgi:hypothetical protein
VEHLVGEFVLISFFIINSANISIDDHLGANDAWPGSTIQGSTFDGYAVACRLDNDVLFCVQASAKFMPLARGYVVQLSHTAHIQTVWQAGRSTIIPGRQYPLVFNQYCAYSPPEAGGALGDETGYFHKISVPTGP